MHCEEEFTLTFRTDLRLTTTYLRWPNPMKNSFSLSTPPFYTPLPPHPQNDHHIMLYSHRCGWVFLCLLFSPRSSYRLSRTLCQATTTRTQGQQQAQLTAQQTTIVPEEAEEAEERHHAVMQSSARLIIQAMWNMKRHTGCGDD